MLWKINTCIHIIHSIVSHYLLYHSYLSVDLRFVHMYCASINCITHRRGKRTSPNLFLKIHGCRILMKKYKKCLFRKNYIQRFAKKDHYMVWKIRLLEYQLIDSAWHKFGSVPDSLKKNPRFWCKFIYWVKLICRYQSHVLLNQSYKCNM